MDFSNATKQAGDLLGGLKGKLGFANQDNQDGYAGDDDYYDEYDDYAPENYEFYDDVYSDRLEYTTRGGYNPPALVTPTEARVSAHNFGVSRSTAAASTTPMPAVDEVEDVQPDPGYDVPATALGDFVSPYKRGTDRTATAGASATATATGASAYATHSAATSVFSAVGSREPSADSASSTHSAGLNSLFASTDTAADAATAAAHVAATTPDPFDAFEAGGSFSHHPARELTVIKPYTYEDVSSVARAVRAGDAVVLSLRSTDPALAKRVLDFSFGVASALDAQVDCPADKVFVIIKGSALTLDERHRLHQQGIL